MSCYCGPCPSSKTSTTRWPSSSMKGLTGTRSRQTSPFRWWRPATSPTPLPGRSKGATGTVSLCASYSGRDLSHVEATRIIGERIGKPDLQYVQFSYADEEKALVEAGMSESFAELYVEMTKAFNEGIIKPHRTPENTTPTRFEDFVGELAQAYEAMGEVGRSASR